MYFEHTYGSVGDLSSKNYFAVKLNVMQPSSCYKCCVLFNHKVGETKHGKIIITL